jgi:predicted phage terminase large subunit-like protein
MQRLHQEDLSARCIELGYTQLKLPAVANERTTVRFPSGREVVREAGSVLWPDREGPAEIAEARRTLGSYGFSGQYEQEPSPIGGGLFQRGWFGSTVDAVPLQNASVRYWDKAGTQGAGAYTAGVLMARSPEGMYYVVDVVRGQWSAGERERRIRQTAEQDGLHVAIWIEQEPGSGGKESAQNTILNLAGWNARAEPVTGDKVSRARPFAAQAEATNVRLIRDTPSRRWNAAFLDEVGVFPTGTYKDQVDAASGAFNKLALATRPGPSAVAGRRPGLAWSSPDRRGRYG